MTDIFVSYSRKDKPFVERLVTNLEERGKTVWVDWENIPLTANWMTEIETGIEEADNFLFVISPDSATSEVAQKEIQHAATHNKRFVPVLYREPERKDTDLPDVISSHNWVFIRDEDDFDTAIDSLLKTIDTDLDYVRGHTRLLTRAIEWSEKDHDKSFLLDGKELLEASKLLDESQNKLPKITNLQVDYLVASQQAERWRKRERILSLIIAAACVVAVIALVIAFTQYREARNQSHRAQELSLAANSQVALSNFNRDLAIALGLFAVEEYSVNPVRPETERALADAAYSPGTISRFELEESNAANSVDFAANGDIIISGASNGILHFWHRDEDEFHHFSASAFSDVENAEAAITDVEVSPDGLSFAFASENGLIGIWDLHDPDNMQPLYILTGHNDAVQSIAFNETGNVLISGGSDQQVLRWDISEADTDITPTVLLDNLGGSVLAVAHHPSENIVLVMLEQEDTETGNGFMMAVPIIIDAETGDILATVEEQTISEINQNVAAVAFHPNGRWVVTSYGLDLHLWSIEALLNGEELQRPVVALVEYKGHGSFIHSLAFSPDGSQLISSDRRDTSVRIWDVRTGVEERRFEGHSGVVQDVAISANGRFALSGSEDGSIRVWELTNGAQHWVFTSPEGPTTDIYTVDYSPNGDKIAVAGDDAIIFEIDLETEEITTYEADDGHSGRIWILKYDPSESEHFIYSAGAGNEVIQWNTDDHSVVQRFIHPDYENATITTLDLYKPDDGNLLLVAGAVEGFVAIWDVNTGNLIEKYQMLTQGAQLRAVAFSPDGQSLLIGTSDNNAYLMTRRVAEDFEEDVYVENETPEGYQLRHNTRVNAVAFNPQGTLVATGESDGTIRLWDLQRGRQRELKGHTGQVRSVAFDDSGRRLLSSSADTTLRLWDVRTGLEVRHFQGHERWVNQAVFSPDFTQAVSGSWDESIRIWNIHDMDQLIEWIRENRYIRELTCAEREIYQVERAENCEMNP